jgi:rifampicin phosphotransferase
VRLADLGRLLETHFGGPQDVEWALADGEIHLLQSRPVTTL